AGDLAGDRDSRGAQRVGERPAGREGRVLDVAARRADAGIEGERLDRHDEVEVDAAPAGRVQRAGEQRVVDGDADLLPVERARRLRGEVGERGVADDVVRPGGSVGEEDVTAADED